MIFQSLKMAYTSVISNKMRAFLTMLGIIIGVMSLVVLVSLAKGASDSVTEGISQSGNPMLSVNILKDKGRPLSWEEVEEMKTLKGIKETASYGSEYTSVQGVGSSNEINLMGVTPEYFSVHGLETAYGRLLKYSDLNYATYAAVINQETAKKVFGRTDVAGKTVIIGGRSYQIAGVLEKGKSQGWNAQQMEAYIPYSTMIRSGQNTRNVGTFYVTADSEEAMRQAENQTAEYLKKRFHNDSKAFKILNQSEFLKLEKATEKTMMLMLGGIAGISLLVGGIGIMNIMLVSVTERTREIGIRKAIGADYLGIMQQFLIEALGISLTGCLIGVALSWGIIQTANYVIPGYSFTLSAGVVWTAVIFSAVIGLIFGIYPADKAAKKKTIEALRFS